MEMRATFLYYTGTSPDDMLLINVFALQKHLDEILEQEFENNAKAIEKGVSAVVDNLDFK